jgi:DNA-directed RNA polymerase I subunit RPA12
MFALCALQDYRRRFNLEPLVKNSQDEELEKGRKRATVGAGAGSIQGVVWLMHHSSASHYYCALQVDEPCPKCGNPVMEFYTMQLRSADEGQTVFYECAKCG